ncbi:MAG: GLPGLI family protein [Bacteroidota bacterium]|nr:GLPGLI family protein [Bacteroidota bacterium]
MKIKSFFFITCLFFISVSNAQQFISKAVIEYEVVSNIQKTMGNGNWAEMLKENMPKFKTGYYTLTFSNDKSVYKFDHWAEQKIPSFMTKSDEENTWYYDFNSGKYDIQKNVYGSNFNIEDSIPKLQWRLTNESRVIAGFNCRKAVTQIFDSVYVFAFYTDEILIPAGPVSINGLPGTILGVTIPRLFTSWIATKVTVNGVDEKGIKPVSAKKTYTMKEIESTVKERTKDWYSDDAAENEEEKQQKARFIWGIML